MLQYLLNVSAIWLISLVVFDVFLRRESYHSYNRFYLLFTFLLGAFLPMCQWQDDGLPVSHRGTIQRPVEQVINIKQSIVAASTTHTSSWNWTEILLITYLTGVLITIFLLLIDIIKLSAYFNSGKKLRQANWTIIETGKRHAPFSFLNILYVSSIANYNPDEWDMILIHEKKHTTLLHVADLLLMQASRIIFWFHPLVYVYNKRLLMVHEYQADNAAENEPRVYGRFLIEQSLLQTAPSLSHSFNRSPIKNRIVMLTRKSSAIAKGKMFVFLPLVMVCIVCFSKNSFSQKFVKNGNIVTYNGNTFELSSAKLDTTSFVNPVSGETTPRMVQHDPIPLKMNDKLISGNADKQLQYTGPERDLRTYLIKNLKSVLGKLDDGSYNLDLSNMVIDTHGRIVYFEYADMRRCKTPEELGDMQRTIATTDIVHEKGDAPKVVFQMQGQSSFGNQTFTLHKNTNPAYYVEIDKNIQSWIFQKICELMDAGDFYIPATFNGEKILYLDNSPVIWNSFMVKDHKVYDIVNGTYVAL